MSDSSNPLAPPHRTPPLSSVILRRTADLLVIAIIVGASLTLGRQILSWWSNDTPLVVMPAGQTGWGQNGSPVELQFGEMDGAFSRQVVRGNESQAVEAMLQLCQTQAASAQFPAAPPDADEQALLSRLNPKDDSAATVRVYQLPDPMHLTVAARRAPEVPAGKNARGVGGWRVVCWGMCLRIGESEWSIHVFRKGAAGPNAARSEVAVPPGCRRILTLADSAGGSMLTFEGETTLSEVSSFFDTWFASEGWEQAGWHRELTRHSGRFRAPMVEAGRGGQVADVFLQEQSGTVTGMVNISPSH